MEDVAEQFDFGIQATTLDVSQAAVREQVSIDAASGDADKGFLRRPSYKEYVEDIIQSDTEKQMMGWSSSEIPDRGYALHDLDGDGEQELLIICDGFINSVIGWKDGKTEEGKTYCMTLCENNILIDRMELRTGEIWYHIFYFANDGSRVFSNPKERSIVRLKVEDGVWWKTSSTDHYAEFDTQITEAEAMDILNSYKPVELDIRSILEFEESQ